jgi:hypothetical protein
MLHWSFTMQLLFKRLSFLLVLLCLGFLSVNKAWCISFDVAAKIAAQQVNAETSHEKMIVLPIKLSVFVSPNEHAVLNSVVFVFDCPTAEFQVVDFLPKTTLDTSYAGNVAVNYAAVKQQQLAFDATGYYKALTGAYATGAYRNDSQMSANFAMLPPRELVLATGTVERGSGVYFKLQQTSQRTIEGEHCLFVIAKVPQHWRGDVARLRCYAYGKENSLLSSFEEERKLSQQDFLIALHAASDTAAEQSAQQFLQHEQQFRQLAAQERHAIERNTTPKMLRTVGIQASTLPNSWISDWLYGPTQMEKLQRLPNTVKHAAVTYANSRSALHALNGRVIIK